MDLRQANQDRFNTIANDWDADPRRVYTAQKIARAMRNALALDGTGTALEFGAGTGLITLIMAAKLAHVTALDASSGMLAVLRQKCERKRLSHVELIEGNVPEAIPDARYDLIYSSMTLHHIADVPALLEQLAGHLAAGGRIALADLDHEDGSFHGGAEGVAHHGFERGDIEQWLQAAGFTDIAFTTAVTAEKDDAEGQHHSYPIFLVTARRA